MNTKMSTTQVSDLEPQALLKIFSCLPGLGLSAVTNVCNQWRDLGSDEQLWQRLLLEDWNQEQAINPQGGNCGSFRRAYASWATEFKGDPSRPAVLSALKAWGNIESWMKSHFPDVASSLRPGVPRSRVEAAAQQLGRDLPPALAALYRVHDGQALWWDCNIDLRHQVPGAEDMLRQLQAAQARQKAQRAAAAAAAAAAPAGPAAAAGPAAQPPGVAAAGVGAGEVTKAVEVESVGAGVGGRSGEQVDEPASASGGTPSGSQVSGGEGGALSGASEEGVEEGQGTGAVEEESDEEEEEEGPGGDIHPSIFQGLFGGYSFYEHLAVTRMLPLSRAVWWTQHLTATGALRYPSPCLVVAASFNLRKLFVVDLTTGDVYVNSSPTYVPAAPPTSAPRGPVLPGGGVAAPRGAGGATSATTGAAGPSTGSGSANALPPATPSLGVPEGSVMGWFSEYGARLKAGWYKVAPLDSDLPQRQAVCLFPVVEPALAVTVTRGVRVTASSVYAPEVSSINKHLFTYSVRFKLLSVEEQSRLEDERQEARGVGAGPRRAPVTRCQLLSRHWIIRDGDLNQIDEVMGEGVIGKFPILTADGEEFIYQSCTHQETRLGFMEGMFRFVEGNARTGTEFDAVCPRFRLGVPDYIY